MSGNRIKLWETHPTLFRSFVVFALVSIGLGFNFWLAHPTFNPYAIPKAITGSVFFALGVFKLLAVFAFQHRKLIRVSMVLCLMFIIFWGVGTSITFFTGQTSLQLFILYSGLAALQYLLLAEPLINPLTAKRGGDDY